MPEVEVEQVFGGGEVPEGVGVDDGGDPADAFHTVFAAVGVAIQDDVHGAAADYVVGVLSLVSAQQVH